MEMRIKRNSAQLKRSLQGVEKSFSGVDKCGQPKNPPQNRKDLRRIFLTILFHTFDHL